MEFYVDLVSLGQQLVQIACPHDASKCGLSQLGGGIKIILHFDDRLIWIHDAKIDDGIHFNGDIVTGDDILGRDVQRDQSQTDPHQLVDSGDDKNDTWPFGPNQPSQSEDNPSFIFPEDLDGCRS